MRFPRMKSYWCGQLFQKFAAKKKPLLLKSVEGMRRALKLISIQASNNVKKTASHLSFATMKWGIGISRLIFYVSKCIKSWNTMVLLHVKFPTNYHEGISTILQGGDFHKMRILKVKDVSEFDWAHKHKLFEFWHQISPITLFVLISLRKFI